MLLANSIKQGGQHIKRISIEQRQHDQHRKQVPFYAQFFHISLATLTKGITTTNVNPDDFMAAAVAGDISNIRRRMRSGILVRQNSVVHGPRSFTVAITHSLFQLFWIMTLVPNGNVLCATVKALQSIFPVDVMGSQ